jgi:hypothetical protein
VPFHQPWARLAVVAFDARLAAMARDDHAIMLDAHASVRARSVELASDLGKARLAGHGEAMGCKESAQRIRLARGGKPSG